MAVNICLTSTGVCLLDCTSNLKQNKSFSFTQGLPVAQFYAGRVLWVMSNSLCGLTSPTPLCPTSLFNPNPTCSSPLHPWSLWCPHLTLHLFSFSFLPSPFFSNIIPPFFTLLSCGPSLPAYRLSGVNHASPSHYGGNLHWYSSVHLEWMRDVGEGWEDSGLPRIDSQGVTLGEDTKRKK